MRQSFLPIEKLADEPYSKILGYPKYTKRQITSRINELRKIGISSVSFNGKTKLGKLDVLGKGYVGIVILARKKPRKIVALKIRRLDSQRDEMVTEGKLLKKANSVGVGPILYSSSKNFLVMDFLDGEKIGDWVHNISGKGSVSRLKNIVRKILEDCYNLDQAGLDHGELSSISKHVIVGESKTTMIDFESSSTNRRVSNVTSATQGIFIGSGIAKKIHRIYRVPPKEKIIESLRQYKNEPTRKSFDVLLKTLKL